ncbi:hypothetical protein [Halostreptopolyspora alba]|uniref:Uncharacterized protein n=1 Tax=Halostreptopolyspora alba TaxID=2487137 RepID=A0A3N0EDK6_9ACTN|nr:hypothetical protein EFW17_07275 [Nocardiopsaceae bacterium YIM 96095]
MVRSDQPRDPRTGRFARKWPWRRAPGAPSLWERVRSWFSPGDREPEPREGWIPDEHGDPATVTLAIPDTLPHPFDTPSKDDAFTFHVKTRIVWKATVTDTDPERRDEMQREINRFIEERKSVLRSEIMSHIRPLGRDLEPHRADELEKRVADEHARIHFVVPKRPDPPAHGPASRPGRDRAVVNAPYDLVDAQLYAWVDVCDEIRAKRQESWLLRMEQVGAHERELQRIAELAERQERWRSLLIEAMKQLGHVDERNAMWITADALRLASDDAVDPARVLEDAIRVRADEGEQLTNTLADMIQTAQRQDAGLFEFAFSSDTALRRILEHLGVPVQDLDDAQHGRGIGT